MRENEEMSPQNIIILSYKNNKISYEDAKNKLLNLMPKGDTPKNIVDWTYWETMLFTAKKAKED